MTRKQAIANFKASYIEMQRLPGNSSKWTVENRQAYNAALSQYILSNPAIFDFQDRQTAATVQKHLGTGQQSLGFFEWLSVNTGFDIIGKGYVLDYSLDLTRTVNPFDPANREELILMAKFTAVALVAFAAIQTIKVFK